MDRSCHIWIGQLDRDLSIGELATIFGQFGEILWLAVHRDEVGMEADIIFDDGTAVYLAGFMNGTKLLGKPMQVRVWSERPHDCNMRWGAAGLNGHA